MKKKGTLFNKYNRFSSSTALLSLGTCICRFSNHFSLLPSTQGPVKTQSQILLSPDRYTDTGLLELEVQFVGIGKFADTKKNCPPP